MKDLINKVIGHTKTGKVIYGMFNNENHKDFTKEEHKDAAKIHLKKMNNRFQRITRFIHPMEKGNMRKEVLGDEKYSIHNTNFEEHFDMSNWKYK